MTASAQKKEAPSSLVLVRLPPSRPPSLRTGPRSLPRPASAGPEPRARPGSRPGTPRRTGCGPRPAAPSRPASAAARNGQPLGELDVEAGRGRGPAWHRDRPRVSDSAFTRYSAATRVSVQSMKVSSRATRSWNSASSNAVSGSRPRGRGPAEATGLAEGVGHRAVHHAAEAVTDRCTPKPWAPTPPGVADEGRRRRRTWSRADVRGRLAEGLGAEVRRTRACGRRPARARAIRAGRRPSSSRAHVMAGEAAIVDSVSRSPPGARVRVATEPRTTRPGVPAQLDLQRPRRRGASPAGSRCRCSALPRSP